MRSRQREHSRQQKIGKMNVYSISTQGALLPLILLMSENTGPFGFTEFVLLMLLRDSNDVPIRHHTDARYRYYYRYCHCTQIFKYDKLIKFLLLVCKLKFLFLCNADMIYSFYQPLFSPESDRLHDWRGGLYDSGSIILLGLLWRYNCTVPRACGSASVYYQIIKSNNNIRNTISPQSYSDTATCVRSMLLHRILIDHWRSNLNLINNFTFDFTLCVCL